MPELIVNTSPLQYLHQIRLLDLLPKLFGRITVADPVARELAAGRNMGVDVPNIETFPWVDVKTPISPAGVLLAWDLGAGESASLSLALERAGAWVLLDDRLARAAALHLRIPLLGTLGVLLRAKQAGALQFVSPSLERLKSLGFRLRLETQRAILKLAGE